MSGEPTPAPDERVGQVLLGKLEVVRRIGGGGMGDVYEVEHLITQHRRALKIVRAEYARQRRYVERLLREASVAGRLKTPYVVETLDAGRLEDESAYILMELLEGISLHDMIHDEGQLGQRRLASIMCQVAEGIGVAHQAGIVHRDLKPENVFVTIDEETGVERVKILDFGVSKMLEPEEATRLTREGTVLGTPFYMAPEQASGRDIDGRVDVWAMGVIMYEALTTKLPFWGDTIGEVFIAIGAGHYVPITTRRPDVDPAFAAIVHKALAADPAKRYPSAEAMRRELIPFAGNDPVARGKTISDAPLTPKVDRSPRVGPTATPTRTIEDGLAAGSVSQRSSRPPPPEPEPVRGDPEPIPLTPKPAPVQPTTAPARSASVAMALPTRSRAPIVAGAIALFAIAIGVIAWGARDTGHTVAAPRPTPRATATPDPLPVPVPEMPPDPPRAELAPEREAPTRERPSPTREAPRRGEGRTRAEAAGLEGNPYGDP